MPPANIYLWEGVLNWVLVIACAPDFPTSRSLTKPTPKTSPPAANEQKITITASTNLNKADLKHMVQHAERGASEDNRWRETVQARNEADQAIYQDENSLRDRGG